MAVLFVYARCYPQFCPASQSPVDTGLPSYKNREPKPQNRKTRTQDPVPGNPEPRAATVPAWRASGPEMHGRWRWDSSIPVQFPGQLRAISLSLRSFPDGKRPLHRVPTSAPPEPGRPLLHLDITCFHMPWLAWLFPRLPAPPSEHA